MGRNHINSAIVIKHFLIMAVLKSISTLSLREMVSFPQKQELDIKFLANLTKWLGAAAIGG